MRRSQEDLEHGDTIRAKLLLTCSQCGAGTTWRTVTEYADHVHACMSIALGQAVKEMDLPQLDEMLPEKPAGWKWGR